MCDSKNQSEGKTGTYHMLIVDDEPLILAGLVGMVKKRFEGKFLVYQADCADEALKIFRNGSFNDRYSDAWNEWTGYGENCVGGMAGLPYCLFNGPQRI